MSTVFSMKAGALTQADESASYCRRDNRVNRDNLFATTIKVVTVVTVDTENCILMKINMRFSYPVGRNGTFEHSNGHKCFCVTLDKSNRTLIRFVDYKRRKVRWFYKKNDKRNGRQRLGQSQQ